MKVANLSTSPSFFKWEFPSEVGFNIYRFIEGKQRIYDADNCGESTTYWVVVTDQPKFYKSVHGWWWNKYIGDDSYLENQFEIFEVNRDDLDKEAKGNLRFVV